MDGGTRLVNHSPHQPGESFFHYPKMPSFMKQQFPKPYRPPRRYQNQEPYTPMAQRDYTNYDAQKPRSTMRRAVDYSSSVIRRLEARIWQRDERDQTWIQPDPSYVHTLPPPSAFPKNPSNTVTTKFVHCSTNKVRCPVFCVVWTPEGRRLVTGASSGEFTLWNGLTFNFETILQAHDYPIRTMCWSHNDLWLLSGDDLGYVKYWQSNMNNVQMFQAHKDQAIRGVRYEGPWKLDVQEYLVLCVYLSAVAYEISDGQGLQCIVGNLPILLMMCSNTIYIIITVVICSLLVVGLYDKLLA